jgi:uncharacterized protein YerC
MKEHRIISSGEEIRAEDRLFNAVLQLNSIEECRAFFRDLSTPAELQAMKDRWGVAEQPPGYSAALKRLGKLGQAT